VLPLENLSDDESQDIFAEGIVGEMIASFSKLSGLDKVMSRSASMRYKGTDKPPQEIAAELDVQVLVGGMFQIQDERARITAELIDGQTGSILWSETFESLLRDVLTLQGEIARLIAAEIKLNLTPEEESLLVVERPVAPEAYEAYLWGNKYMGFVTLERLQKARETYGKAIAIDSTFAPAYTGLSRVFSLYRDYEKAEEMARKALALDPNLPVAHQALGQILLYRDWDWQGAENEMVEAQRLSADQEDLGPLIYGLSGQMDKALDLARRKVTRDPLNAEPLFELGWQYSVACRPDDAIATYRKLIERIPGEEEIVQESWHHIICNYTSAGLVDSSLAIAARQGIAIKDLWSSTMAMMVFAAAGMPDSVRLFVDYWSKRWEELEDPNPKLAWRIGLGYGFLGDNDKAFEWLEKAYEEREWMLLFLNYGVSQGELDNLLDDPRLADLMHRVGIPRTYIALRQAYLRDHAF
jgi:TolB-like protein/Flp pilus assembly protein TadD